MELPIQFPELDAWASGFPIALLHAAVALGVLVIGGALYALLSPHREVQQIREGNLAASLSFAGVVLGIALPIAFALSAAASTLEVALWGISVVMVQLLLFWITDVVLHGLPQRVKEGEIAAAALLVAARLSVAAIVAAAVAA